MGTDFVQNNFNRTDIPMAMNDPAGEHFTITRSDSINFIFYTRGIYVGVGGNITIVTPSDTAVLYKNTVAGTVIPIRAKRVNLTGTDATDLVGMY